MMNDNKITIEQTVDILIEGARKTSNTLMLETAKLIKAALINNQHSEKPVSKLDVLHKMVKEREIRQVFVDEDTLYSALLYIYRTYIGTEDDSIDEIIEGIQDNIENYIEELIKEASPYNYSNGDIDAEDITELVTEDEFLEKFKKWYLSD